MKPVCACDGAFTPLLPRKAVGRSSFRREAFSTGVDDPGDAVRPCMINGIGPPFHLIPERAARPFTEN
jgi:hypothetical protein